MIAWILSLSLILSQPFGNQSTGVIDLQINSAKSDKGVMRILVFKSPKGFPDEIDHSVKALSLRIKDKGSRIEIKDLPPGKYAIAAFHDEDENGKINTNPVGYPIEKYGFSNNAKAYFGPPEFEKASFTLESGIKNVTINLR
ncbi:DUF2141 domain-containing protein [Algoriphagus lacus]|uniref:DUF2141 domain-containing protein n=1 Tax=Algoriphagus lacus TaxID=2056311 RepID=A0A418PR73_9BACT|nr:DUF2141 domain-containing protein [Algoriphagus lacus]RIW15102.1 DUF2141 domain-containing protein [Algoriphagus lacus]